MFQKQVCGGITAKDAPVQIRDKSWWTHVAWHNLDDPTGTQIWRWFSWDWIETLMTALMEFDMSSISTFNKGQIKFLVLLWARVQVSYLWEGGGLISLTEWVLAHAQVTQTLYSRSYDEGNVGFERLIQYATPNIWVSWKSLDPWNQLCWWTTHVEKQLHCIRKHPIASKLHRALRKFQSIMHTQVSIACGARWFSLTLHQPHTCERWASYLYEPHYHSHYTTSSGFWFLIGDTGGRQR